MPFERRRRGGSSDISVRTSTRRVPGWTTLVGGLALLLAGQVAAGTALLTGSTAFGAPLLSAVSGAAAFLTAFVGVMAIGHRHVNSLGRAAWADAVVAVSALHAAAVWALTASGATSRPPSVTALVVLSPTAWLVLVMVIAGIKRVQHGDAKGRWNSTMAGVGAAWASTVLVSLAQTGVALSAGVVGTVVAASASAPALAGLCAVAVTARRPPRPQPYDVEEGIWVVLAGPILFGIMGLVVLSASLVTDVPTVAVVAALVCLVATGGRVGLSLRELAQLAESRRLARTDDLTGLANRRWFYERIRARTAGRDDEPFSLLLIDLSRFRLVNEALGSQVGDRLLQLVAQRLGRQFGGGALVSRLGGDEFTVLVEGEPSAAVAAGRLVHAALSEPVSFEQLRLQQGANVGIARWPDHGATADDLVAAADLAVARAKSRGSGLAVFDPAQDVGLREVMELTAGLRAGLPRGEVVAHFQPKVHLDTGRIVSTEALVRWRHPERGLLSPAVFLDHAERAGLMPALTALVLDQAVAQTAAWNKAGHELSTAVNITSASLVDNSFPDQVATTLDHHCLPPHLLTLEITEETVLSDPDGALAMLGRLRDLGVGVAIDDYGTGRASLAHLRDLPATELKLDRSFTIRMLHDDRVAAIVASTVALAAALGLEMVAEGIEERAECAELQRLGCRIGQGYLFGRPETASVMAATWLTRSLSAAGGRPGGRPSR